MLCEDIDQVGESSWHILLFFIKVFLALRVTFAKMEYNKDLFADAKGKTESRAQFPRTS